MAGGPRRRRFHLPHRHRGTVAGDQSAGQGNEQYAGNQQYPGNQPYSANQPYPGGPQQGGAPGQPGQYPSAPPPRENG
jgi:hypothetical protein